MKTQDYKFSIIDIAVSESYKHEEVNKKCHINNTLRVIKTKLGKQARKMASVVDGRVYVGPYRFEHSHGWESYYKKAF